MEAKLLVFIAIACAVSCVRAGTVNVNVTLQNPNITRTGCGTSKLCFTDCDPQTSASSCFFGSSKLDSSNTTLSFELSGATTGYVALGLATNNTEGASIVFVCGNSNATNSSGFVFLTASQTSNSLNLNSSVNTVISVQGVVVNSLNQSYIQCIFSTSANLTTTTTKSSSKSYYVSVFSGVMSGDSPGTLTSQFSSNTTLDLGNPKANVNNSTSTNTTVSTTTVAATTVAATTGGSNSLSSSAARALAILLSAIGLLLLY